MNNPNQGLKNFLYNNYFDIKAIANDIGMTEKELEKKLNGEDELLLKDAIKIRDSIKNKKLEYIFNYKKEDLSEKEALIKLIDSRIDKYLRSLNIELKIKVKSDDESPKLPETLEDLSLLQLEGLEA